MPRISVIMGVYNCKSADLLKKSVDSIIKQTYNDWEFIICNDGSTDCTSELLRDIQTMDSRIKLISYEQNFGLSYALNKCIEIAQGEYIARQDDDDQSYENRFEMQLNIFDRYKNYDIVGCLADVYDDNGIWGEYVPLQYPQKSDFLFKNPFIHPTVMMKRSSLISAGCYRSAWETRRAEDYDLFMTMYACGFKGYNLQHKLYKYRIVNNDIKYRNMKSRIEEAVVRYKGFKKMGMGLKSIPYIFKPIIIGLIPQKIFKQIRKKQY